MSSFTGDEIYTEVEESIAQQRELIKSEIAEINDLIASQLNEIIHHQEFQKLEASWRGLQYLVRESRPNEYLRIKVLPVKKNELIENFERFSEFDQSTLFKRVYKDVYTSFGENPFGMLIGDYEFSNNAQDADLLERISQVSALAQAPFITAASPAMFGWDNFSEMFECRDISRIFDRVEYAKWRYLRDSENARYLGFCLPHILLREPYESVSDGLLNFKEDVLPTENNIYEYPKAPQTLLWGNAAYAYAACAAKAYRESSWCGMFNGPETDALAEGLPSYEINGLEQSVEVLMGVWADESTGAPISPELEHWQQSQFEIYIKEKHFADLGFIPLIQNLIRKEPSYFSEQSFRRPRRYATEAANSDARLNTKLSYILAVSRFAHYLKVIARDRSRVFTNSHECRNELMQWLGKHFHPIGEISEELRAWFPISDYKIDISENTETPGEFKVVLFLRPDYQLKELSNATRMDFNLPKNQANSIKTELNNSDVQTESELPEEMPENIEITYRSEGDIASIIFRISNNILDYSKSNFMNFLPTTNGLQHEPGSWNTKISLAEQESLYRIFYENKFDLIKNDNNDENKRQILDWKASISLVCRFKNNIELSYNVNEGGYCTLSGINEARYRSVQQAINDLVEKYKPNFQGVTSTGIYPDNSFNDLTPQPPKKDEKKDKYFLTKLKRWFGKR